MILRLRFLLLISKSKEAADEIGHIVTGIPSCIEQAVHLMEAGNHSIQTGMNLASDAKSSFHGIMTHINHVSNEITNVSAVTEQVNSGTEILLQSINNISSIADSVSDNISHVSDAAHTQTDMMDNVIAQVEKLSQLSSELKDAIGQFQISSDYSG